ncbi:MAG: TIGR02587 family membrane protein [Leptolyngbya sp. SIO4C1]|nr:TIGR02587 family membrane protein [Leptolyngbya sp. SIO4C1]
MAKSKRRLRRSQLNHELDDLVRGICGGFLFGVPLLYTVEVWWIGSIVTPPRLIAALLITLIVVYLLSQTEGFRKARATTEREAIGDAIEAVALGLVCAALMLVILRQVTFETRLSEALGKIIFESVPFSLGVALANQFLRENEDSTSDPTGKPSLSQRFFPEGNLNETVADIGATLIGATIIAFSIAPTDEVMMLVSAVDGPWLLLTVVISLILSYSIVFQANFTRQGQRQLQKGLFQSPLSETVISYLVSLLAAALMLGFFRQISLATPWDLAFRHILILGLPATIGGAAGRLAL